MPKNGGDRIPTGHLLSPNETSSTGIGLHLVEMLVKGVFWESPNNPDGCSPQTDGQAPLLETTPTQLIKHGEVQLVPTESFHHCTQGSFVQEGTLSATKGETHTNPAANPLSYNGVLPARYARAMVAQSLWE